MDFYIFIAMKNINPSYKSKETEDPAWLTIVKVMRSRCSLGPPYLTFEFQAYPQGKSVIGLFKRLELALYVTLLIVKLKSVYSSLSSSS